VLPRRRRRSRVRRREGAQAELPPGSGGASGTFASAAATWNIKVRSSLWLLIVLNQRVLSP